MEVFILMVVMDVWDDMLYIDVLKGVESINFIFDI